MKEDYKDKKRKIRINHYEEKPKKVYIRLNEKNNWRTTPCKLEKQYPDIIETS